MSRWIGKAEALAERIRGLDAIVESALEVVVLQEHDPIGQVTTSFEKSARGCILVAWLGGRNPEPKPGPLRIGSGNSVTVWLAARPDGGERQCWLAPADGSIIAA